MARYERLKARPWWLLALSSLGLCSCGSGDHFTAMTLAEMCTPAMIQSRLPVGATVKDIPNMLPELPAAMRATKGGTALIGANAFGDGAPSYCLATGSVLTNPLTGKTANFGAVFPAPERWNGKYLQMACGGNCGAVFSGGIAATTDMSAGFAVWYTDDGHIDRATAWGWSRTVPGQCNRPAC